ncbi:Acg family FMN-binding oxidoreductase [Streptomyces sp. NRRL S-146]|uniref:Acg family FMN-binding oxidoreductase n=1 Tax=Streptomyces sp. NRRL S-146 TaxID=1463884 RepID=UPI000A44C58E|nr:nitroreductase family protein [Streptomyces sp. NRRL S-146]
MSSTTLDALSLERLVAAAVAAPSLHNTQPWRFRLDTDTRTVCIDAAVDRALRHTDPVGRAVHLSVGCALLNLRIAAAHFGWEPVTRLLPCPDRPARLAAVRLAELVRGASSADLYEAVWRRRSSRFPFSARPLPSDLLAELTEAARLEGANLRFPGRDDTDRVLRATREAECRNRADADRAAESRLLVSGPHPRSTGLPSAALGRQDALDRVPMRDFGAHRHPDVLPARAFETRPTLALLSTAHDRRSDWLRAGQALERVLLLVTRRGVRASLLHQAMEWPDLRDALDGLPVDGPRVHTQMVIRLGYGPEGPTSPRRPVEEVMSPTGPSVLRPR